MNSVIRELEKAEARANSAWRRGFAAGVIVTLIGVGVLILFGLEATSTWSPL